MDKDKDNRSSLPEAPASVTAKIISDKGFHLMFTLRDTTVSGLLKKFEEFQQAIINKGWQPDGKISFDQKKYPVLAMETSVPKEPRKNTNSTPTVCNICGAPATKKSGVRKDGSTWEGVFCSTGEESHKVWLS